MRLVEREEILSIGQYESIRDQFRNRIIREKKVRRFALGPEITGVFENHDTVMYQIQEMIRTERISKESSIRHEIETYNALVPGDRELSATLMIEIDDKATRDRRLVELAGIERCVGIVVGGEMAMAAWESDRILDGRASAVLYYKFPLSEKAVAGIRSKSRVEVVVAHEHYKASITLSPETIASLAEDFE